MIIWPPTPTPLPAGLPKFEMGSSYSLWEAAPTYLQVWQWAGPLGGVLQLIILLVLIAIGGALIYRQFQKFTDRDSQS